MDVLAHSCILRPKGRGIHPLAIKNAKNQDTSKTESQNSVMPESQVEPSLPEEKVANLTIKVPLALRQHWVGEAKKQGTSLTAVIIEALTKKFGTP